MMFQCSKLLLLCSRVPVIQFNCRIFTYEALLSRRKKVYLKNSRIVGPLDDKIEEELSPYDEDDEQDFEKYDFMKGDLAYDEFYRESKRWKSENEKKIIINKFFSPAQQPAMLTYREKECIKYLNKQDPIQWNIQALSESFPATPDIIKRVLRSRWTPSLNTIKQMDTRVLKNWELLKAGKLNADPKYIEHLHKFVDRREVLLEQVKNSDFYLPEVKQEKVWNNGEMNKILTYYEKKIEKLQSTIPKKLFAESSKIEESQTKNSDKNVVLFEQNNKEQVKLNLERQETNTMKEMFSYLKGPMTLEEFKNNAMHKAEAKSCLSRIEKKIFESNFDKSSCINQTNQVSENNKQSLESLGFEKKKNNFKQYKQKLGKELFSEANSVSVSHDSTEKDSLLNEKEILDELLKQQNEFQNFQLNNNDRNVYENSNLDELPNNINNYTQNNVHSVFENKSKENKESRENKIKKEIVAMNKYAEFIDRSPENMEKDRMVFDEEENNLKNTAFWNHLSTCEEKKKIEKEKEPLNQLKDFEKEKFNRADLYSTDSFPLRIKLPKSSRGSGLIFKIRDCYYDDDGEFLYRVPGMTK